MGDALQGRVAIVTGSDSGIGQAVAIEFARAGADVAITWLHDEAGAQHTRSEVEAAARRARRKMYGWRAQKYGTTRS